MSAFHLWKKIPIDYFIEKHKRIQESMYLNSLHETKLLIWDGKIICYKIKKVKIIQ